MKNLNILIQKSFKATFLTMLLFILTSSLLNSQDFVVDLVSSPELTEYIDENIPITADITNLGNSAGFEVIIEMVIIHQGSVVYQNFQIVPMIAGGETVQVTTLPGGYITSEVGTYTASIFINYAPDPVQGNNHTLMDFEVGVPPIDIFFEVFQVNMINPNQIDNSTYGIFRCEYIPIEVPHYINAVATLPGNEEQIWIVQNLPMLPHEYIQTVNYWFDYASMGAFEGMDINDVYIEVTATEDIILDQFIVSNWEFMTPVNNLEYNVMSDNLIENESFPPPSPIEGFPYVPITTFEYEFRGCNVPNIDLENDDHPASPTYAGDMNACGPAAAANSMKWLEVHNDNIENTDQTVRDMMEELSEGMDREDNQGVTTTQLIKGKLAYIDNHELPIHVKFQSDFIQADSIASPNPLFEHKAENKGSTTTPTPPTWEFYKSEMDKGEDVEILFGWYDNQGNRHGGHWVTSSGYYEDDNGKGIYIKDDGDQDTEGGTSQTYHEWVEQDEWSRLKGYTGANNNCWIESVVSESFDPEITFDIFGFAIDWSTFNDIDDDPLFASFTFKFPPRDEIRYVNVLASEINSTDEEWVLRNVMLPPYYEINKFRTWWDLSWIDVADPSLLDSVHFKISVTDELIYDSFFEYKYELDLEVNEKHYNIENGTQSEGSENLVVVDSEFPVYNEDSIVSYIYRGCHEMPNIDLHSETDSTSSDTNACGPAATANSMHWLESIEDSLSTDLSLREKLEELKGYMGHTPEDGVTMANLVKGKLAYIDAHNLPIHVKFQGDGFGDSNTTNIASPNPDYGHEADNQNATGGNLQPTWDFILSEMENDEDVELCYGTYYTNTATDSTWRVGGHTVVVNGANESGGVRRLAFKHDYDQENVDSTEVVQDILTWHDSDSSQVSLLEWSDYFFDNEGNFIEVTRKVEGVISESYDAGIVFTSIDEIMNQNVFDLFVQKNPTSKNENIQIGFILTENTDLFVEIYNNLGQMVYQNELGNYNIGQKEYTIESNSVPASGAYIIVLKNNRGAYSSTRIVRE